MHLLPVTSTFGRAEPKQQLRRRVQGRTALRSLAVSAAPADIETLMPELKTSLHEAGVLPPQKAEPVGRKALPGGKLPFLTSQDVKAGQVVMEVPSELAVTAYDVKQHEVVAELAEGRSELTGLALWVMAERAKGEASAHARFLATLPESTLSPILWKTEDRSMWLRGTTIEKEAGIREAALRAEWAEIEEVHVRPQADKFSPGVYNEKNFLDSFLVVLTASCYLPAASCFALLPLVSSIRHSGAGNVALDYDAERDAAVLVANGELPAGTELAIFDDRPNGELLLSTGSVEPGNPCDFLTIGAKLVQADGLYSAKRTIVEAYGLSDQQEFPVYRDRFPIQLLAYLRLARVQDTGELMKVDFEDDGIISQLNEYETLQILMGDCRDILSGFQSNVEDDRKELQNPELTERERLGIQLRVEEQIIAQSTMDSVRRRLAPIRGIPTKKGLQDPNQDLLEVFETLENIPNAPKKIFDGFASWARGDYDPEFQRKKKNKK